MRKHYWLCSLLTALIFVSTNHLQAQLVGPNAYIKATSLEIGLDGAGGFEGCSTAVSTPLPGMHFRSGNPIFGFVANPQVNAWTTFDGDFFTPGTPENGWGMEIPGVISASNNCANASFGTSPEIAIPGAITDWQHVFDCYTADWEGDVTGPTNLHFKVNYFLQENDLFYTTTISVTNNTAATIPEVYYYRNLDPDNNVSISFDYTTTNTIVSQPGGVGCNLAHVKATSVLPGSQPQSYVGLAAIGANWKAMYGGFSNRDATDIWNASGIGFEDGVGMTNFADEAIAIAYKIQNLAPGATEVIRFVVILDDASATQAINNLLYLTYPGSTLGVPQVCTPDPDTIPTCGGAVPISVTGPTTADYTWTWSPGTGLSTTTGSSTVANPSTTTTYTVSGAPLSTCVAPITFEFVVLVTPADGNPPIITPVPTVCVTSGPFNLAVDSLGGVWSGSGIIDPVNGTFDPAVAGVGNNLITYVTPGYCNTTDTLMISVVAGPAISATAPPAYCAYDTAFNLTASPPGGVWSGSPAVSGGGSFDPTVSGDGTFVLTYSVATGACVATDTALVTIVLTFPSTITTPPIVCEGAAAFNLTAATPGGTWSGTGITSATAGTFNPTTGGSFVVTYALPGLCGTTDTATVTVVPVIDAIITIPAAICANASPINLTATPTGGVWSGTGITSTSAGTFNPATAGVGTFPITYNAPGGCGDSDTENVTVLSVPAPAFTSNVPGVCKGGCVQFNETGSATCSQIIYDFGDGLIDTASSPIHCYDSVDVFDVAVTCIGTNGCVGTTTISNMITVYAYPVADFTFSPGSPIAPNAIINFTDISTAGLSSAWTFGDTASGAINTSILTSPSHYYPGEGTYCVTLVSTGAGGCMDTAKYCLEIIGEATIFYPNVFTPNGDGNNDFFQIGTHHIRELTYDIYDRWGLKIATYSGVNGGWDGKVKSGKLAPDGVYYYILKATADNGELFSHEGFVQLLSER